MEEAEGARGGLGWGWLGWGWLGWGWLAWGLAGIVVPTLATKADSWRRMGHRLIRRSGDEPGLTVAEVANSGENHGDTEPVGGGDDVGVFD